MENKTSISIHLSGSPLFIVFLVLKLTSVISWSWWWITAPIWMPIGITLAIYTILFFIGVSITIVEKITDKRRRDR